MLRKFKYLAAALLIPVTAFLTYVAWPLEPPSLAIPGGKDFVLAIMDDTDRGTVENLKPVYDHLKMLGIKATKSVWPLASNNPKNSANLGQSLQDPAYRAFIAQLQEDGFEISFHGPRGGSSTREDAIYGLNEFKRITGYYPRVHANHSRNRDNLYWGKDRFTVGALSMAYTQASNLDTDYFQGANKTSPMFWGDIAQARIRYVRNFVFDDVNTLKENPSMPYHLPSKPYANKWFSASDGDGVAAFNALLSDESLDRLAGERGVSIIYTHFGKGFTVNGKLNAITAERLKSLAARNGHFTTVSQALQLLENQEDWKPAMATREIVRMEVRWLMSRVFKR